MKHDLSLVGLGLYTVTEAAILARISAPKIRRWLTGHVTPEKSYPALWASQLEQFGFEQLSLSFLDLVQLRVAKAFIDVGLSPQKVRRDIEFGSAIVASTYPFAHARFRTDGKTVILHVLDDDGDEKLVDLFKDGQHLMHKVIEPSLKNLDFDERDLASRWWPLGHTKGVVIDPRRQFGQPIDDATGVPTSVLSEAARTEGSAQMAARRFMVPVASVNRAVAFESQLAA